MCLIAWLLFLLVNLCVDSCLCSITTGPNPIVSTIIKVLWKNNSDRTWICQTSNTVIHVFTICQIKNFSNTLLFIMPFVFVILSNMRSPVTNLVSSLPCLSRQISSWITLWQMTSVRITSWWDCYFGRSAQLYRSLGKSVRYLSMCWRTWWLNTPLMTATPPRYSVNEDFGHNSLFYFMFLKYVIAFQSQQARLATLYLPLFGLLQENVNRLNVKEVSPITINHSNNVRVPSSGFTGDMLQRDAVHCIAVLFW